MNTEKRIAIYGTLREQMPTPTTELNYKNPFELMVAVILSAQATDISVNKATDKLYPVACTPESILAIGVNGLKSYIRTIGLLTARLKTLSRHAVSLSKSMAVKYHEHGQSSKLFLALGGKQRMSF